MQNHPLYREYGKQGALGKTWSAVDQTVCDEETVSNVAPERRSRLAVKSALHILQNAVLTAQQETTSRVSFKIWKFIFKRKIVSFKANGGIRVFQQSRLNVLIWFVWLKKT